VAVLLVELDRRRRDGKAEVAESVFDVHEYILQGAVSPDDNGLLSNRRARLDAVGIGLHAHDG
jgi:hypothetical protein